MKYSVGVLLLLALINCSSPQHVVQKSPPQTEHPVMTPDENELTAPLKTGPPVTEKTGILLSWPLKGTIDLTRGFLKGIRPHQGLDLSAPKGSPVRAAHAGYVEYAGKDFSGYGNLVIINSGSKWATFYAHLSKILVREGQNIRRGTTIGKVGATGNARGVHLHFELRFQETPVDPMAYLP